LLDGSTGQLRSWFHTERWHPAAFRRAGNELVGVENGDVVVRHLESLLARNDKVPEPSRKEVPGLFLQAELVAELVANKSTYHLDLGRKRPEDFSKLLLSGTQPPTPTVDLTLKVKNAGKRDLKISSQSERFELHLVGDGAINLPSGFGQWIFIPDTKPPCSLAAGESRSLPITSLQHEEYGNRSLNRAYWVAPGEYTVFVTYHAGVLASSEREKGARRDSGSVTVPCAPIKLTVQDAKK
jgi:hypothetical protein